MAYPTYLTPGFMVNLSDDHLARMFENSAEDLDEFAEDHARFEAGNGRSGMTAYRNAARMRLTLDNLRSMAESAYHTKPKTEAEAGARAAYLHVLEQIGNM